MIIIININIIVIKIVIFTAVTIIRFISFGFYKKVVDNFWHILYTDTETDDIVKYTSNI